MEQREVSLCGGKAMDGAEVSSNGQEVEGAAAMRAARVTLATVAHAHCTRACSSLPSLPRVLRTSYFVE